MSFLLQATATVTDWDRLADGLQWLSAQVGHPAGLVGLRIFRDHADPTRVTMLEEWDSADAFERSFAAYSLETRAEFLARLGLSADQFERAMWDSTALEFGPS